MVGVLLAVVAVVGAVAAEKVDVMGNVIAFPSGDKVTAKLQQESEEFKFTGVVVSFLGGTAVVSGLVGNIPESAPLDADVKDSLQTEDPVSVQRPVLADGTLAASEVKAVECESAGCSQDVSELGRLEVEAPDESGVEEPKEPDVEESGEPEVEEPEVEAPGDPEVEEPDEPEVEEPEGGEVDMEGGVLACPPGGEMTTNLGNAARIVRFF